MAADRLPPGQFGAAGEPWWKTGVLYQIYPRSFADSNADGQGDLRGIVQHLDYLEWLGVDGIWLSSINASPNADWGYDVADYRAIHPDFGSLGDLDELIAEGAERGIRILLDLVPNHTSDQHPWFVDSRSSRTSPFRDWYVWADPRPDGSPPNNWVSSFGGLAWTLDDTTGQYYLHNHLPAQPDLNWWNDEVRAEFDSILRFWLDRGVAGFRIDVCSGIVKDALLRDNPPATADDDIVTQVFGQQFVYNGNRPEVHEVIRGWRRLAEAYEPARVLIGETPVDEIATLAGYYGSGHDELHLAFNFPFIKAAFEAEALRSVVEETEALLPAGAWPAWTGSNHDMARLASRWACGDPRKIRLAILLLLTLRGTPVLYQGDEIGLEDVDVGRDDLRDPLGSVYWPAYKGRDAMRTPMPWEGRPGGGFTPADSEPWLPLGDVASCNVASQRTDPGSVLSLTRDLIALRKRVPELRAGGYSSDPPSDSSWVWRRGERITIAVNLSDAETAIGGVHGRVLVGTDRERDGAAVRDPLVLRGWEGLVVETAS